MALAARLSHEDFCKLPAWRVDAHIDSFKIECYYRALPIIEVRLSEISDDSLDEAQKKEQQNPKPDGWVHPLRVALRQSMLEPYMPDVLRILQSNDTAGIKPMENMSKEAALGIVEALNDGAYNSDDTRLLWVRIAPLYKSIAARAKA